MSTTNLSNSNQDSNQSFGQFSSQFIIFGLSVLTIITPIQNTLILILTRQLGLPLWISLWKEVLIIVILVVMLAQIFGKKPTLNNYWNYLIVFGVLNIWVLLSSFVFNNISLNQFVVGYRFEVFWLWLVVIGYYWVKQLNKDVCQSLWTQLNRAIMTGLGFGLILAFAGLIFGADYLQLVGYTSTNNLNSGIIASSPICHAVDFGFKQCRLSSPFSSPNHLASYLLLILGFLLFNLTQSWQSYGSFGQQILFNAQCFQTRSFLFLSSITVFLILMTYSRFALLGLLLMIFVFVLFQYQKKYFGRFYQLTIILGLGIFGIFGVLITSVDPAISQVIVPPFLTKPSSSMEHYRLTQVNLDILKTQPDILIKGLGQASSGPAAKYSNDFKSNSKPKLVQDFGRLSYKWFIVEDRIVIPENWYIQLILNGGLFYAIIYLIIVLIPLKDLLQSIKDRQPQIIFYSGFLSIILGNMFLHLWENQTIVIYWSILNIWLLSRTKIIDS